MSKPRRRRPSSSLFRAAWVADDVEAVASGNPSRVLQRARNVALGRLLGRAECWRWK